MKWIKTAIGALIAIMSIGIIATNAYKMTQETVRDEVVIFEVLTLDDLGEGTVTSGTYDKILLYSEIDNELIPNVTNVTSILINDVETLSSTFYLSIYDNFYQLYDSNEGDYDKILPNDTAVVGILSLNDIVEITFEVPQPPQLTGISATLILLTPIIFTGGFLIYLFRKQKD